MVVQGFGLYLGKKKFILSLFILLFSNTLYSQCLTKYDYQSNNGYYLNFNDGQAKFKLSRPGGLGEETFVGMGKYKIRKNKICVITDDYPNWNSVSESYFNLIKDTYKDSTFLFKIQNKIGDPLQGVSVAYKNNNKYNGSVTDDDGKTKLRLKKIPVDSIFSIKFVGYQPVQVPVHDMNGAIFEISLAKGNLIFFENEKICLFYKISDEGILIKYYKETDYYNNLIRK